ncbi:MAG: hypothetical protein CM1200mP39_27110 [Dehalococcoidia bacterium]|nr:MAG: hypothetical protein CM1200mP39_27110 [Dehalococcoidia bacterium]
MLRLETGPGVESSNAFMSKTFVAEAMDEVLGKELIENSELVEIP